MCFQIVSQIDQSVIMFIFWLTPQDLAFYRNIFFKYRIFACYVCCVIKLSLIRSVSHRYSLVFIIYRIFVLSFTVSALNVIFVNFLNICFVNYFPACPFVVFVNLFVWFSIHFLFFWFVNYYCPCFVLNIRYHKFRWIFSS